MNPSPGWTPPPPRISIRPTYLNQKEGMAIVMVTHDLKAALKSARTVLHIGRKGLFSGTVADYLASPQGRRFREELES